MLLTPCIHRGKYDWEPIRRQIPRVPQGAHRWECVGIFISRARVLTTLFPESLNLEKNRKYLCKMPKRVLALVDFNSDDDDFINTPWVKKKTHRVAKKKKKRRRGKFWRVGPSEVTVDERFTDKNKGLGVFATRSGRFRIHFRDCVHVSKTHMGGWGNKLFSKLPAVSNLNSSPFSGSHKPVLLGYQRPCEHMANQG